MIISYDGKDWEFDRESITVDEWRELKRKYKMSPRGFENGTSEADPDAMTFLYWAMLRQDGDLRAALGDQLKPDIIALHAAMAAALAAEADDDEDEDAGAEADPTGAGAPPAPSPPAPATPDPGVPPWQVREGAAPVTA